MPALAMSGSITGDMIVRRISATSRPTGVCARPLKRTIQRKVLDALAREILAGHFKAGDAIMADVDKQHADRLVFLSA